MVLLEPAGLPHQKGMVTDMKKVLGGLRYSLTILSHPIRGFYEMRFEDKGSLVSCVLLLLLMVAAMICQNVYTGLSFAVVNIRQFHILRTAAGCWCRCCCGVWPTGRSQC